MMHRMEMDEEEMLVGYEKSINNLIKISVKLMYLRSFMRPYFCEIKDENGLIIVGKNSLS